MTIPLLPRTPPRNLLEGGPLVATPPGSLPQGRRIRPAEMIELDRTGAERVAKAALLLAERSGLPRSKAGVAHGFSGTRFAELIAMAQPWRVSADVVARLEVALELQPGDILAGRAPQPKGEIGRTSRSVR